MHPAHMDRPNSKTTRQHSPTFIRAIEAHAYEPTELNIAQKHLALEGQMVGEAGIEPTTTGLEGRCSIQLSYSPW